MATRFGLCQDFLSSPQILASGDVLTHVVSVLLVGVDVEVEVSEDTVDDFAMAQKVVRPESASFLVGDGLLEVFGEFGEFGVDAWVSAEEADYTWIVLQ